MANILDDKTGMLTKINYVPLMNIVENILKEELGKEKKIFSFKIYPNYNLCSWDGFNNLVVYIVERCFKEPDFMRQMGLNIADQGRIVSINHTDKKKYSECVEKIPKLIRDYIREYKDILDSFKPIPLACFQNDNESPNFDLLNTFKSTKFEKQKAAVFPDEHYCAESLRTDSVEIRLNVADIEKNLKQNLKDYVNRYCRDEEEAEELCADIDNGEHGVDELVSNIANNSLKKMRSHIGMNYLKFLYAQRKKDDSKGMSYVEDYIRRFTLFEEFLYDLNCTNYYPELQTCCGVEMSKMLNQSDALDCLPFIGLFQDLMVEKDDGMTKSFKFGGSLKRNQPVSKYGKKSVIDYQVSFMKGEFDKEDGLNNKLSKKVLNYLIYTFFLVDIGNMEYNPIENWKMETERFKDEDESIIFATMEQKMMFISKKMDDMREALDRLLNYKAASILKEPEKKEVFVINSGYLNAESIRNGDVDCLFRIDSFNKDMDFLRYSMILDTMQSTEKKDSIIISIPFVYEFKAESIYIAPKEPTEINSYDYYIKQVEVLPFVFVPEGMTPDAKKYYFTWLNNVAKQKTVSYHFQIPYYFDNNVTELENAHQRLLYRIVYSFLVFFFQYEIVKNLNANLNNSETAKNRLLFIPLMRLHLTDYNPTEPIPNDCSGGFIKSLCMDLEQLLNEDENYICTTQGIVLHKTNEYKIKNAKASMYHRLPKQYKYNKEEDRVALIYLTSIRTDTCQNAHQNDSMSLVSGEVYTFTKIEKDKTAFCRFLKSFNGIYQHSELYRKLPLVEDVITDLYHRGFKKILYITDAPYTSTIHAVTNKELYFHSEELIHNFKQDKPELVILPLYYTSYSVHEYDAIKGKTQSRTMYIDQTSHLDELLKIGGKNNPLIAGIFGLFTGKAVSSKNNRDSKNFYRSAVIYSTMYNIYDNTRLNIQIAQNLIHNKETKDALMELLTLFHFSKYESVYGITTKVDPYDRLSGDTGILKASLFNIEHENKWEKNYRYNLLAFLVDMKKIVDKEK